jgi:hypothetical protein
MAQSAPARPKIPQKSHNRRVPGPSGLPGRKPATPHAAGSWPRSRRAATRGGGNPVIELEYRITVYPARDGHDQWRAVWYENAKRRQCEAVSGESRRHALATFAAAPLFGASARLASRDGVSRW